MRLVFKSRQSTSTALSGFLKSSVWIILNLSEHTHKTNTPSSAIPFRSILLSNRLSRNILCVLRNWKRGGGVFNKTVGNVCFLVNGVNWSPCQGFPQRRIGRFPCFEAPPIFKCDSSLPFLAAIYWLAYCSSKSMFSSLAQRHVTCLWNLAALMNDKLTCDFHND